MSQPHYRLGDHGPAVAEIRGKLALVGLLPPLRDPGDPDALSFDAAVDRAVRQFQQERAMIVDGVIGPVTYRALEEARFRLGDRLLSYVVGNPLAGDDVSLLQRRLQTMGFDVGRVDGIFGVHTLQALQEFQHNVGLPPDGTCGPATFKALAGIHSKGGDRSPESLRAAQALERAGPALSGKVVVVDPGHGGLDRGVVGHGLEEADVAFDLATRVEGRLTATGVNAWLTRSAALSGRLDDRTRAVFANDAGADLVISLHCDAQARPAASGVTTYYYGNDRHGAYSAIGERFAGLIQREVVARTDLVDGRTHPKTWDLLRYTRMAAVRVELGYLSNPHDAARLAEPGFRDVVAEAIVVAVQRTYLSQESDAPTGVLQLRDLAPA